MNGKNINFEDKNIKKSDIDVNKILVSKKEPFRTKNALKYFIGYNDNNFIRPLCLRLPQMTGYVKNLMKIQQCLLELTINSF